MRDKIAMRTRLTSRLIAALGLVATLAAPLPASAEDLELTFDRILPARPAASAQPGRTVAAPAPVAPVRPDLSRFVTPFRPAPGTSAFSNPFEAQIAALARADAGRIGVAAMDLSTGRAIGVLGDQPFPMASTSKVAIVATFLQGVDEGRFRLTDQFPMMMPIPSRKFDGPVAPVRPGTMMSALGLIELTITRSDNQATDALLAAVGGPQAVNRWLRQAGMTGIRIDRDIATLVRDDGAVDPATHIDVRDSATPMAMVRLLSGLYNGQWLSASSRSVLIGAMERCVTGRRRIPALLPEGTRVAHKTGTLNNTTSDVGIIHTPDGRAMAVAIYVTGQGGRTPREGRIATIARAIYDGYSGESSGSRPLASR